MAAGDRLRFRFGQNAKLKTGRDFSHIVEDGPSGRQQAEAPPALGTIMRDSLSFGVRLEGFRVLGEQR